ncbi:CPCC family cysteine-rich protein [Streptomyces sp. HUAS MG47]|uniref:CPCC family cysteine-rich protein n=1 Tax=Streptomyces solicamelliae TaxID=3231716 RepID=UPI003877C293
MTSEDSTQLPRCPTSFSARRTVPTHIPAAAASLWRPVAPRDICTVCYWEDAGQDEHDDDVVRVGPNGSPSLVQAPRNFEEMSACDPRWVNKRPGSVFRGAVTRLLSPRLVWARCRRCGARAGCRTRR